VAYHVQIARAELELLESLAHVSSARLADVLDAVQEYLSDASDEFRAERRLALASPYFLFDYLFQDAGHSHQLLFYVDDSHAPAGILVVAFVDHKVAPSS
jgi:hypothetical protein